MGLNFGPFLAYFQLRAARHTPCPVSGVRPVAHGCRMLIGACNRDVPAEMSPLFQASGDGKAAMICWATERPVADTGEHWGNVATDRPGNDDSLGGGEKRVVTFNDQRTGQTVSSLVERPIGVFWTQSCQNRRFFSDFWPCHLFRTTIRPVALVAGIAQGCCASHYRHQGTVLIRKLAGAPPYFNVGSLGYYCERDELSVQRA